MTLSHSNFYANTAYRNGGGISNGGTLALTHSVLQGNAAAGDGGGALYFYGYDSYVNATITNGLFNANGANHIGHDYSNPGPQPHFINCTFSGATTEAVYAKGFGSGQTPLTFTNSIFWGNNGDLTNNDAALDVTYSVVEEAAYASGTGNTHAAPLFVDAAGGNLRLQQGSPAIDAGDDGAVPSSITTDLDGFERFVWGVDMGAYESQYEEVCEFAAGEPITLGAGQPITLTFGTAADLGTLSCITVTYFPTSHPTATVPLQTAAFWTLGAAPATATFTVTLTLPYAGAHAGSRACRYPGGMGGAGWDCGDGTYTSYSAGAAVTRAQVTAFSDWTIGNDVTPTRVSLTGVAARRTGAWLPALGLVALAALFTTRRSRRR